MSGWEGGGRSWSSGVSGRIDGYVVDFYFSKVKDVGRSFIVLMLFFFMVRGFGFLVRVCFVFVELCVIAI